MTTHEKILKAEQDQDHVVLRYDGPDIRYTVLAPVDQSFYALVEALIRFDMIEEGELIIDTKFATQLPPDILLDMTEGGVSAGIRNGDTGYNEEAEGRSVIRACAKLFKDVGFKPDGSTITLPDFMRDFQYGLQRISDEQLQAEMEAITTPEKGAW